MKHWNPKVAVALLALFAVTVAARAEVDTPIDVRDTVKESFAVQPGGTLYLDIDRGNIDVVTRHGDAVIVELERIVDANGPEEAKEILERHAYEWRQRGDDVYVTSRFDSDDGAFWKRWRGQERFRLRVTIQVPTRYNVDFESGAGNIKVGNLTGFIEGRTGAGNMTIGAVEGQVEVSSGSGNVDVERVDGEVDVRTGAGNIRLSDIRGYVEASTGAGNIYAELTGQPRSDSRLESGAGNVTVAIADRVGVTVNASSGIGSASTDFPLTVEGKWMSKSMEGRVNGGGPLVRMRAGVGNVAVVRR